MPRKQYKDQRSPRLCIYRVSRVFYSFSNQSDRIRDRKRMHLIWKWYIVGMGWNSLV